MKNALLSFAILTMMLSFGTESMAQPVPGGTSPVITEIMYNPPETNNDSLEFIEILNPSLTAPINMAGYFFSSGINYTFPAGFVLGAGEYVLVTGDSVIFESVYGMQAMEWQGATTALNNSGEGLALRTAGGAIADTVFFGTGNNWPQEADGDGYSLVLCDPTADNNLPANWTISENATGIIVNSLEIYADPGAASTCTPTGISDDNVITTLVFPNPTEGEINLKFAALQKAGNITIHNGLGQIVYTQSVVSGTTSARINAELETGFYILTLDNGTITERHTIAVK